MKPLLIAFLVACLHTLAAGKPSSKEILNLKLAAHKGDSNAQYMYGSAYYFGEGVVTDFSLAVDWYKKSATQGNSKAQYILGAAYWYGKGLPKDPTQTYRWWLTAASNVHPLAKEWLAKIAPHLAPR